MYNILIVEDSKPIVRDITRLIKNSGYEIELRISYDGEDALIVLNEFEPDIIFTDIKMPVMDGLTLIQKVKNRYPYVKCVIISGYADFSFTHEALMLQVDDYVMKPVEEDGFQCLLKGLIEKVQKLKNQNIELRMQKLLQEGIVIEDEELPSEYMLSLVRVGNFQQYAVPLPKDLLHEVLESQRIDRQIWIVNTKLSNEKLLVYTKNSNFEKKFIIQNEKILDELKQKYTRVNIICSSSLNEIQKLNYQYTVLSNQLGRKILLDSCNLFVADEGLDERKKYICQKEEIEIFRKKIERILKSKAADDYKKEIQRNIQEWKYKNYSVYVLRKFIIVLLDELFIMVRTGQHFVEEPGVLADKILNDCQNFNELETMLKSYNELLIEINDGKNVVSAAMAQKFISYMQTNVYNNLSLQDLADYFEISPSYICRVFKVYYSDTPISYYNKIKIEEARRLLNVYQNMKIKDIAEMLGFGDQYYFSKVFKQQYGVSPLMYKTQLKNDLE